MSNICISVNFISISVKHVCFRQLVSISVKHLYFCQLCQYFCQISVFPFHLWSVGVLAEQPCSDSKWAQAAAAGSTQIIISKKRAIFCLKLSIHYSGLNTNHHIQKRVIFCLKLSIHYSGLNTNHHIKKKGHFWFKTQHSL